jgi:uncharacterized membrane protein
MLCAVAAILGMAIFWQTVLESDELSLAFLSAPRWQALVTAIGGKVSIIEGTPQMTVPFLPGLGIFSILAVALIGLAALLQGAGGRAEISIRTLGRLALAWSPAGLWWLLWMTALLSGWTTLATILREIVDLTAALCIALSALALWPPGTPVALDSRGASHRTPTPRRVLIAGMLLYVVVFTAMNWGLWFNLRLPHGDSAMYEEHLWNLEHGKGFRSYLDQGLFLGEHLQVVHVLLVPLHILFPSQLTLELAQSIILALGAWPVFNIARRHSGSDWAAALLGLAYLAYFPLQYLDIAIDLKTFRPNSFGIPALLAAIDLLERRRYGWAAFWLAITLSAQEDWAIPITLLGAYFAAHAILTRPSESLAITGTTKVERRRELIWGIGLFVFGVSYLWFALNVAIPWFRGGATVHTASYFSKFGNSPGEIVKNMLTNPGLLFSTIATPAALVYALRLLLPVGFLPLFSPGRLVVAAPLFLLLLMNDLAMQVPAPVHHFHAPIIPLLFWAAAAGLGSTLTVAKVLRMCRRMLRLPG